VRGDNPSPNQTDCAQHIPTASTQMWRKMKKGSDN